MVSILDIMIENIYLFSCYFARLRLAHLFTISLLSACPELQVAGEQVIGSKILVIKCWRADSWGADR